MLIRILADNPGKTFTRNLDTKFVDTVKELLRVGRDPSVKQILMETLDTFQREKQDDEGLAKLNEMWKKEHERMVKIHVHPLNSRLKHKLTEDIGPGRTTNNERTPLRSTFTKLLRTQSSHKTTSQPRRTSLTYRRSPNLCQAPLPTHSIHPSLGNFIVGPHQGVRRSLPVSFEIRTSIHDFRKPKSG